MGGRSNGLGSRSRLDRSIPVNTSFCGACQSMGTSGNEAKEEEGISFNGRLELGLPSLLMANILLDA
jgi:hypothetical protein